MAKAIMVIGTSSGVGKSLMATALCRIFSEAGLRVAPFKSQNMSLNAAVTPDGLEMGRAQAVQAHAAGIDPSPLFNPVLLKPTGNHHSQVVLNGVAIGNMEAKEYYLNRKQALWQAITSSYEQLAADYELIIIEGAGSPVEMNLKANDLANMRVAEMANADVILVADIDRGGVFASVVGTLQLLDTRERERVKGILINRFRGDPQLFEEGKKWMEEYTGVPVLGVIPYLPDLAIAEEDSLAVSYFEKQGVQSDQNQRLRIGILRWPHLANFSDFDPLVHDSDIDVVWVTKAEEMHRVDAIILPGTKSTLADREWMMEREMDRELRALLKNGGFVLGICGGFQMMGDALEDRDQVESTVVQIDGLGLFPMTTSITGKKATRWVSATLGDPFSEQRITGYEMHMGVTNWREEKGRPFATINETGQADGALGHDGRLIGTYLHHLLHNDHFRLGWLNLIRGAKGWNELEATLSYEQMEEASIERLAETVLTHVDRKRLFELAGVDMSV